MDNNFSNNNFCLPCGALWLQMWIRVRQQKSHTELADSGKRQTDIGGRPKRRLEEKGLPFVCFLLSPLYRTEH